jgi:hypothetical protein
MRGRFGGVRRVDPGEIALHRAKSYSGAPRPMKMGTTPSPWRYDAAACRALQSAKLRYPATLHYPSRVLPSILEGGAPVTLRQRPSRSIPESTRWARNVSRVKRVAIYQRTIPRRREPSPTLFGNAGRQTALVPARSQNPRVRISVAPTF